MKKNVKLILPPGIEAFEACLRENANLFNMSEFERLCDLPTGTLRHIRTGGRNLPRNTFQLIQKAVLPKLVQMVFTLQNYPVKGY